jgi:serine kinase of HPr protein (carbohydrate metabolism regulator)
MAEVNIHAGCVAIGARGVLLLGPPGAGKSDIALQLMDGGAKLVADDRTILFVKNGALHARPSPSIEGLIEIRGVGIVKMPVRGSVRLTLAVRLGKEDVRLPRPAFYRALNRTVPQITLDARFASTPARIRAALLAFSRRSFRDTFVLKE